MSEQKRELKMGVYRHYKGKDYLVIGKARHSETGEELVVYIPLYATDIQMAVRPVEMFLGTVDVEVLNHNVTSYDDYKTVNVWRFSFINKDGSLGL